MFNFRNLDLWHKGFIFTSVFGGIYDSEFEEETTLLFEKIALGQVKCVYSNLTEKELANAPERIRIFFNDLKGEHKEKVEVSPEALKLAQNLR